MNESALRALIDDVRDGRLARRDFIARLAALGLGAPLAAGLLADVAQAAPAAEPPYPGTKRGGGGPLRLLFWQGPTLLNPHFANGSKDFEGSRPFYEPLARCDADGNYLPVLAAEIPTRANGGIAADGTSVTWKLKRGVTWHDGAPFTADDVVFNWQFVSDPATSAFTSGSYANVKAIEKIDAYTVRVVFAKASPIWDRAALTLLIPKHVFAPYQGARSREAPANLKPVGTGPYRCVDFRPGDSVRGELNPAYHLPNRPFFDTLEIKGGGDATSAARAVLQTGEFDFAWNVLVEDDVLRRMEASGKGRVVISPTGATEYILLNAADPWTEVDGERSNPKSRHPVFSDPVVRQAFRLLMDRASIQQFVFGRTGVATPNYLNNPAQFNSTGVKSEFNVDKANALLEGAGWKRGADGVRVKDGRRLKFVFQTSINTVRQKIQQVVKQSCAKAGMEIELKTVSSAVFFSSDAANPDTLAKFYADIEMCALTRAGLDPDRFMQAFCSWEVCRKANLWQGFNQSRWTSDEYDALQRASQAELDPVKRAALFIRMNDVACNGGHVVPVAVRLDVAAVSRTLRAPMTGWDVQLSAIHDWHRA